MNQLRVLPSGLSAVGVPNVFAPRSSVIAALIQESTSEPQ